MKKWQVTKQKLREKRRYRVRKKLQGTGVKPRLSVVKTLNHIYVQLIDDLKSHTIAQANTQEKSFASGDGSKKTVEVAKALGKLIAERAREHKIEDVVFDRNGYNYHGSVQAPW